MGVVWKSARSINTYDDPFRMDAVTDWEVTDFISTTKVEIDTFSVKYEVFGSGFKTDSFDYLRAGHVTKIVEHEDGKIVGTITGINLSVMEAFGALLNPFEKVPPYMEKNLAGNDVLIGGKSTDYIDGYAGDDVISGRRGDDSLRGEKGADTFVFSAGFGNDIVEDFDATSKHHDVVDLSGLPNVKNFADLIAHHVSHDRQGLHIGDGDDALTLWDGQKQVHIGQLGKEDFIFA